METWSRLWVTGDNEYCIMPEDGNNSEVVSGEVLAEMFHTAPPEQRKQWMSDLHAINKQIATTLWDFQSTMEAVSGVSS